jgi:hypothetical protein
MLILAVLGMVTSLCAAYDGGQGRGSPDGRAGGEHTLDKGDKGGSFKGDGYHDWLSPWEGYNTKHTTKYTTKPWHPDYPYHSYTYPVYYYYYSMPYYYSYPYYGWYYTPQYYDQWWDPWWATNVYGTGGVKYTFKSGGSYQSGFGFGDP